MLPGYFPGFSKEGNISMPKSRQTPLTVARPRSGFRGLVLAILVLLLLAVTVVTVSGAMGQAGLVATAIVVISSILVLKSIVFSRKDRASSEPKGFHVTSILSLLFQDPQPPAWGPAEELEVIIGEEQGILPEDVKKLVDEDEGQEINFSLRAGCCDGDEVIILEDSRDEELVVSKTGQYIEHSISTHDANLSKLRPEKNLITMTRKKIALPGLESREESMTPWSSTLEDENAREDATPVEAILTAEELPVVEPLEINFAKDPDEEETELPLLYPEIPQTPEEVREHGPAKETEKEVTMEHACHDVVLEAGNYFSGWRSLGITPGKENLETNSAMVKSPNYAVFSCPGCSRSFTSARKQPCCPHCRSLNCQRT